MPMVGGRQKFVYYLYDEQYRQRWLLFAVHHYYLYKLYMVIDVDALLYRTISVYRIGPESDTTINYRDML